MARPVNPRRCPSSISISLPAQKRRKIDQDGNTSSQSGSSNVSDLEVLAGSQALHQECSGDSAGTWFKNANEHVQSDTGRNSMYDDEAPFYIGSQEPYRQLPHSGAPSRVFGGAPAVPPDSEKEDLRDVIDDLTIENKKLKKRLRSHQSRTSKTSSSRAEDKLFEVRIHGMRADKKRELEILLKNFATSLEKDGIPSKSTTSRSSDQLTSMSSLSNSAIKQPHAKPVHTDSGYGSNSHTTQSRHSVPVPFASKDHTIKSYLHDIPDILLPHESYPMSEKARMALVVRRLEQLFTGKTASLGDHQQPIQQQEVSRSAARVDKQEHAAQNKQRRPEGAREANILSLDGQYNLDASDPLSAGKSIHSKIKFDEKSLSSVEGSGNDPSHGSSPGQRPTRPLDLDIGRAQVAQDNLEYIRHLNLQAPAGDHDGNNKSEWIYLNLLTGMAQLHVLNVTPDFVRRAIKKRSTKLELSKDLHQVRWRGGDDKTMFSHETERAMERTTTIEFDSVQGEYMGNKTCKTDSASNGRVSLTPSDDQTSREESSNAVNHNHSTLGTSHSSMPQVASSRGKTPSSFDYKPLFHKRKLAIRREPSYNDDSLSSAATDSTGLVDSLGRTKHSGHSQDGEGMLTFFNNAYFCSDLSADKHCPRAGRNDLSSLTDFTNGILGIPQCIDFEENALRHHDACYFAPQFAAKFTPPKHDRLVGFESEPLVAAGEDETQPMEMEASGLGMIVPADNFAIDVKVVRMPDASGILLQPKVRLQTSVQAQYQYQVESAQRIDLQASRLPSPPYLFFTSSSSSSPNSVSEHSGSSDSSSSVEHNSPAPPAFMRQFSTDSSGNRGSMEDAEDDDDSSVDMLRDARAEDPERIAAQEREYSLLHPMPAATISPSLAVTVGTSSAQDSGKQDSLIRDIRSDVDEVGSSDFDEDDDE
jgi:hypothetical protein